MACIVQESGFSIVYFPLQWKCRSVMVKTPSDTFEDINLRPVISDRPFGLDQGVSHCGVTWSECRLEICEFTEFLVMLISIWRRLMDRQHVQPAECVTTHNLSVRLMYKNAMPCWLRGTHSNVSIKSSRSVKSTDVLNRNATPANSATAGLASHWTFINTMKPKQGVLNKQQVTIKRHLVLNE